MKISRRQFVKNGMVAMGALSTGLYPQLAGAASEKPKVYFTKELDSASLIKLYRLVSQDITGKTAIKLHTGEAGGPRFRTH